MTGKGVKVKLREGTPGPLKDHWEDWLDWEQEATADGAPSQGGVGTASSGSSLSPKSPKKRKVSSEAGDESGFTKISEAAGGKVVQDRSHSVVEKRYRENLNQKIADLGDCIPNLRGDGKHSQSGGSASQKRNKATVLTEAMSYIQQLEKRNAYLEEANLAMKDQMQRRAKSSQAETRTADAERSQAPEEPTQERVAIAEEVSVHSEPRGMIPVPEEMRRLWRNQSQDHYANGMSEAAETSTGSVHVSGGKYISRMVIGSLAGFMILNGFVPMHGKHEKREDRGLSAIPLPYVSTTLRRIMDRYHGMTTLRSTFALSYFSKAFLIFCVLGLTLFLYLYYSRPPPRKSKTGSVPRPAPSLASPLEVRQNAWLTSIQTVWVPRHHILPEMLALVLGTAAYLTRRILGWRYYLWLTGRTEEDEIADIRAWDIALDAQLSGGDPEVSKGRLVLTLWASGTLPSTPFRLMLKALHIRVLFWQPSHYDYVSRVLHRIAFLLARYQWKKALKMQERLRKHPGHAGFGQNDPPLPDHLNALLEQSPDEVLNDTFIQRSHNIVWNRQNDDTTVDAIGSVVDDSAMQGPLDLIASWHSHSKLRAGLLKSLENAEESPETAASDIELAIRTASPRSITSACALVARGVLLDADDGCLPHLKWALPPGFPSEEDYYPLPPSTSSAVEMQILIAAHCRVGLGLLRCDDDDDDDDNPVGAMAQISRALRLLAQRPADVGLLGSATLAHTLSSSCSSSSSSSSLFQRSDLGADEHAQLCSLRKDAADALQRLEQSHTPTTTTDAVAAQAALRKALRRCVRAENNQQQQQQRRTSDASLDAGYGTMSDSGDSDDDDVDDDDRGDEDV